MTGLVGTNSHIPVLGISVRAKKELQEENVFRVASATAEKIGCTGTVRLADVIVNDDYVGEGYGIPSIGTIEAIQMLARFEGLLLDPVYTGKAMAGLIDLVRNGFFKSGENIVFLHTGGTAGLFGYASFFHS